jgi:predicted metal-dependent phosphoesterase TrpH
VRVDLHTHSTASDGTDRPGELVRAAAECGLDVVAITDHDTVAGWDEAAIEAERVAIELVPGAEISCAADGISLHLLAYFFDRAHVALREEMERTRDDRLPRAQEIVRRLAAAGHPVTWETVLAQVPAGATLGRPHIADALVAAGVVPNRNAAFEHLLHNDSPFYVRHYAADPVVAVKLIRAAGGVAVFAHPFAIKRGKVVSEQVIHAMADAGLAGLEVDHRDQDRSDRERLRAIAAELDLLVTGSSDYHGTGRENRLGEHLTDPDVYAEIVARSARGRSSAPAAP